MQRSREDEEPPSRAGSRRNSDCSAISRNSVKKDNGRKTPQKCASSTSTPKRVPKPEKPDFMITGKQLLKKSDRANSLPGGFNRRLSAGSLNKTKRILGSQKADSIVSQSSKSKETSFEDDMSLDLSQVSDFEDLNSRSGVKKVSSGFATSTPKAVPKGPQKLRSCSLQGQSYSQQVQGQARGQQSFDSSNYTFSRSISGNMSFSRDNYKNSSTTSNYTRYGPSTELDYSSVSPEYSGQSSTELSPRDRPISDVAVVSPYSHESYMTWADSSEIDKTKIDEKQKKSENGEWNTFWANYNNSVSGVPMKNYYDQCPTPYRTENIDLADLDFSVEGSRKRSPDDIRNINNIIRNEGLHLTPRETQNIIKCAHILGNVLSKAIDRNSKKVELNEDKIQEVKLQNEAKSLDPEVDVKKKSLTLELRAQNKPLEVEEEKKCETVTTQTDISLPNTKSAPKIFEKILRQLSKSSIDEVILSEKKKEDIDKLDEKKGDSSKDEVKENIV